MARAGAGAVDYRQLRPAIEFAVAAARRWRRSRGGPPIPQALLPQLSAERVPSAALGRLGRAIDGDPAFRAAVAELLDEHSAGGLSEADRAWLVRQPGWEDVIAAAADARQRATATAADESARRKEQRRRAAAESALAGARAELTALAERVATLTVELADARQSLDTGAGELAQVRAELAEARVRRRHAEDRRRTATDRLDAMRAERDEAIARAELAEHSRDELLAVRAAGEQGWDRSVAAGNLAGLRDLARKASVLADGLAELAAPAHLARQPLAIPGAARSSTAATARHLLGAPGVVAFIDGYNVAKLAWPDDALDDQRRRLLDLVDVLARRLPAEFVVVFDGASVVGAHTAARRLARVHYSDAGVTADDEIRAMVAATDTRRPVVVITNDKAIRRDVATLGANLLPSEALPGLAHR